jgi:hypothetical protein
MYEKMEAKIELNKIYKVKFLSLLINLKFLTSLMLLDIGDTILRFIYKYVFSDITYLKFLIVACILDLITGITKVWIHEGSSAITSKGLRNTVSKVIQYATFLICIHVLTHFEVDGQKSLQFTWLNKIAYEFLILVEIKSVYENIIKINPKLDLLGDVFNKVVNIIKSKSNKNVK